MRFLLVATALAVVSVPASAEAQSRGGARFTAGSAAHSRDAVRVHRGLSAVRGDRGDRDRRGRNDQGDLYLGYRDYQGDTLWRPESFNDWWHERPERAYPAWMARNTKCERLWWSGGGWRC